MRLVPHQPRYTILGCRTCRRYTFGHSGGCELVQMRPYSQLSQAIALRQDLGARCSLLIHPYQPAIGTLEPEGLFAGARAAIWWHLAAVFKGDVHYVFFNLPSTSRPVILSPLNNGDPVLVRTSGTSGARVPFIAKAQDSPKVRRITRSSEETVFTLLIASSSSWQLVSTLVRPTGRLHRQTAHEVSLSGSLGMG
jgi:hypothetical protein